MEIAFHEVVECIQKLDLEQKQHLKELTEKLIIEERREEILKNAESSRTELKSGKTKSFDNAADIMKSLNAD